MNTGAFKNRYVSMTVKRDPKKDKEHSSATPAGVLDLNDPEIKLRQEEFNILMERQRSVRRNEGDDDDRIESEDLSDEGADAVRPSAPKKQDPVTKEEDEVKDSVIEAPVEVLPSMIFGVANHQTYQKSS